MRAANTWKYSGMQHLNGNLLCAIDIETTGLDPRLHEICQICILPLNSQIMPSKEIMPFYIDMIPGKPENIDPQAMSVSKMELCRITQHGFDQFQGADLLDKWFEKLDLAIGKRIAPLAHNWPFDRAFIIEWLGIKNFEYMFDSRYRDTMVSALFANDVKCQRQAEKVMYPKVNLEYLCLTLEVENERSHDALSDCIATAECYRRMVNAGAF